MTARTAAERGVHLDYGSLHAVPEVGPGDRNWGRKPARLRRGWTRCFSTATWPESGDGRLVTAQLAPGGQDVHRAECDHTLV
jgi:hypothetical protein